MSKVRRAAVVLVRGRTRGEAPTYEEFKARWLRERQREVGSPWEGKPPVPPETFEPSAQ